MLDIETLGDRLDAAAENVEMGFEDALTEFESNSTEMHRDLVRALDEVQEILFAALRYAATLEASLPKTSSAVMSGEDAIKLDRLIEKYLRSKE